MEIKKEYLGKVSVTLGGEYDDTKDYPKLCVIYTREDVSDSFGTRTIIKSYISKKSVPAGTELTNINYWQPFSITPDGVVTTEDIGKAGRVASLNELGLIPSEQLPSYVDDVLEFESKYAFPSTGERGKIYMDLGTNDQYRWSGSGYTLVTKSNVVSDINIVQDDNLQLTVTKSNNTSYTKVIPSATNSKSGVVKFGGTQMGSDDSANSAPVRPQSDNRMGVAPATIDRSGVMLPAEKSEIIKLPYGFGRGAASGKYIIYLLPKGITDLNDAISEVEIRAATESLAGIMTASDKTKLNGIQSNANRTTIKYGNDNEPLIVLEFANMTIGQELDGDNLPTGKYTVEYSLPIATSSSLGGVKFGGSTMGAADATAAAPVRPTNATGTMGVALATDSRPGVMSAADKIKLDNWKTVKVRFDDGGTTTDTEVANPILDITGNVIPLIHSQNLIEFNYNLPTAGPTTKGGIKLGNVISDTQELSDYGSASITGVYDDTLLIKLATPGSTGNDGLMSKVDKTRLDSLNTIKNALPLNVDPNLIFFVTISSTGVNTECTYVGDFSTYDMTKSYKVFVIIDGTSTAYANLVGMPEFEETYITTVKEVVGGRIVNQNRAYLPICSAVKSSAVYVDFTGMGDKLYGTLYGL